MPTSGFSRGAPKVLRRRVVWQRGSREAPHLRQAPWRQWGTSITREKLKVNENLVPMRLQGDGGCANLVAIHNMLKIKGCRRGDTSRRSEQLIMRDLSEKLEAKILLVKDIPRADAKEAMTTLANIRTMFSLKPRLSGHQDFVKNGSRLLWELFRLPVLHGWVLDPQDKSYDALRNFSHSELADYYVDGKGDHMDVCKSLLERKYTSYGFETLHKEMNDCGLALLFCRYRLDVVCKRYDALFIYVVDETICQQINQAVWMLFEEHEENIIYFTDKFVLVKEEPHREKVMKWYGELLAKLRKDIEAKEEERKKSSQQRQSYDAGGSSIPSEATGKRAEVGGSHHHQHSTVKKSPQQPKSDRRTNYAQSCTRGERNLAGENEVWKDEKQAAKSPFPFLHRAARQAGNGPRPHQQSSADATKGTQTQNEYPQNRLTALHIDCFREKKQAPVP